MSQITQDSESERPQGMSEFTITVLLVDDQKIIGEAVRRMLDDQTDIAFHFCQDPTQALEMARQIKPTVILQDLVMPEVDGLTLVKFFRANASTRDTPMIVLSSKEEPVVKAEAFALGANDYLVKLPDKIELVARIRYHSRGYINLLQRNEAYTAIEQSRQRLAEQMEAAAKYVSTLLPQPTSEPVTIDWRYIPCTDLGGDTFGYHWIDDDNFALYLIDVSGHGLDSALLSVTIMNVLRSRSLPQTDFRDPGQVLLALNNGFPMEEYGGKFFTIWYGVFDLSSSTLSWCGGGHPPALLFENGPSATAPIELDSDGPMIGGMPWDEFETQQHAISSGDRLFIYSDGVHEIHLPGGIDWPFEQFVDYLAGHSDPQKSPLDGLLQHVRQLNGSDLLDDDFSIIEVRF
ncbi:MAG: SpoIIE family protein phosphatase [Pirellulales bacterium]|nr:SpoIIE family protein phosphatase [Pirellulales bacterium]